MATENRSITKALGGAEDLLIGRIDQVTQTRNGNSYQISGIDVPVIAASTAAVSLLDPTTITRARVYSSDRTFTDYVYSSTATTGLPSTGVGKWVVRNVNQVDTIADLYELTGTVGQQVSVASYHELSDLSGGGTFVWSTGRHNGGTFIDPNRAFPTDWNDQAQLAAWFADSGVDVVGWGRQYDTLSMFMFGYRTGFNNTIPVATYRLADFKTFNVEGYVSIPDVGVNSGDSPIIPSGSYTTSAVEFFDSPFTGGFLLQVIKGSGSTSYQKVFKGSESTSFERFYASAAWSSWRETTANKGLSKTELSKNLFVVAGTIRQRAADRTKWDWILDASHTPVGVNTTVPATANGSTITIPFSKTASRVVSFVAGADETFASALGMSVGASVGLSTAVLKANSSHSLAFQLHYNGTNWVLASGTGQQSSPIAVSYVGGTLRIEHEYCRGINVSLTPWSTNGEILDPYVPIIKNVGHDFMEIQWVNTSVGTIATSATPTTQMRAIVTKYNNGGLFLDGTNNSSKINGVDMATGGGNIWFYGIMEE